MKNIIIMLILACLMGGCIPKKPDLQEPKPLVMTARYTDRPITIDGKLDEPIWEESVAYPMQLGLDHQARGRRLQEGGEVRLAWDDDYFYVGISFKDSDVVAEGKEDQLLHYLFGDLCELFIKPADQSWYWELYVTPHGKKTSFWYPSRGRVGLPGGIEYECDLKVAAQVDGTLNDWRDRDNSWSAELAISIKNLTEHGDKFTPDADWRILVARNNYSRYLSYSGPPYGPELSSAPGLSITNFHLLEEYAVLKLLRYSR